MSRLMELGKLKTAFLAFWQVKLVQWIKTSWKRTVILLVSLLIGYLFDVSFLSMQHYHTTDTYEIKRLYELVYDAMIAQNIVQLDEVLDDDMVLVHISGYEQPKSEWFEEIQSERMKYFSRQEKGVEIVIEADSASLTAKNLLDARIRGVRNIWRLQTLIEYRKIDGRRKIHSMKATTF